MSSILRNVCWNICVFPISLFQDQTRNWKIKIHSGGERQPGFNRASVRSWFERFCSTFYRQGKYRLWLCVFLRCSILALQKTPAGFLLHRMYCLQTFNVWILPKTDLSYADYGDAPKEFTKCLGIPAEEWDRVKSVYVLRLCMLNPFIAHAQHLDVVWNTYLDILKGKPEEIIRTTTL